MKFLTCPNLQRISSIIDGFECDDWILSAKMEVYSCKKAGDDKRLARQVENRITQKQTIASPLGNLTDSEPRQLFVNLITTLNAAFPDFDFSHLSPEHFKSETNALQVSRAVNSLVLDAVEQGMAGFRNSFWKELDSVMELEHCDVYSYTPSGELSDGNLWSIMYFWFNKKGKKIALLSASAMSKFRVKGDDDDDDEDDAFMEDDEVEEGKMGDKRVQNAAMEGGVGMQTGIVDVGLLDWDDLGMVEHDLTSDKWMAQAQHSVMAAEGQQPEVNLQPVVSPMIRPVTSPSLGPVSPSMSGRGSLGTVPVLKLLS